MGKAFLALTLLFSAFMLFSGLARSAPAKPAVLIFWALIG
ncbi:MAG: hypothetical protein QOD32_599 [Pyrinomonadaceae bacterium]|jgi:hypothetical protein|nr:hypothetical protein [Pyrinomonadaceae bacterium]